MNYPVQLDGCQRKLVASLPQTLCCNNYLFIWNCWNGVSETAKGSKLVNFRAERILSWRSRKKKNSSSGHFTTKWFYRRRELNDKLQFSNGPKATIYFKATVSMPCPFFCSGGRDLLPDWCWFNMFKNNINASHAGISTLPVHEMWPNMGSHPH